MFSYDIRVILGVMALSIVFFKMSDIQWKQIKLMVIYVIFFLGMNFFLTFVFSPQYGVEIYKTKHEIFRITSRYTLTQEQLLYQLTKILKYASVVPLGLIFLLTTNPSEFAASISKIGISYKGAYAVSLTLRYFPDLIRDYQDISLAQQSRGLDLSKKEKFGVRVKNILNICVPLIFSTLDRIELISNAMDLRGFGKHKKRTWYAAKDIQKQDIIAILLAVVVLGVSVFVSLAINHSRFYNPFI
jgi:energy-coupling factor transport system permease protein